MVTIKVQPYLKHFANCNRVKFVLLLLARLQFCFLCCHFTKKSCIIITAAPGGVALNSCLVLLCIVFQ